MENNFMRSDSLVELEFLTDSETDLHSHEDFELLYLLNGSLAITVEEESFLLKSRDLLIVNANRKHRYKGTEEMLLARFLISYPKMQDLLEQNMILFWCNSVADKNEAYEELREIIMQVFNHNLKNPQRGKIFLNSLYYQMLSILTSNFLLAAKDIRYKEDKNRSDDRMQEILQYIRLNYRQNISLQDIAGQLFLSPTYLSKYIKTKFHVSLVNLINSVRLGHAMGDILYSDSSIIKIAMDNGFASVAAFNKTFKETYQTTPSEFRKNAKRKNDGKVLDKLSAKDSLIQQKVAAYLDGSQFISLENKRKNRLSLDISQRESKSRIWSNACGRMINAGTALDLTKSAYQEQILFIKNQIGIKYVRFWDIYAPDFYIDINAEKGRIHFTKLDQVTDFLVKNQLKPYMELSFKPLRLLETTQNALMEIPREQEFKSDDRMGEFFEELITHFIKRYSAEEVQTWYFEYWKKEDLTFLDLAYNYTPMPEEIQQEYFKKFDILAAAFRKHLPEIRIGGGGFSVQHYGQQGFLYILNRWKAHREMPDFISLNCYPYQIQKEGNYFFEKKSTDIYFVKHDIEIAKELLKKTDFPQVELHVSEYSMTLSNRNIVNDSCSKGAFLMQNAIACMEEVDILGYWLATDIYAEYQDTQGFVFGGCGLLSKDGVAKPGFYSFEFLNHLYKNLLKKDKNYILTSNNRGSFRMVCHNYKDMNYNYYITAENKIKVQDIPLMLDNKDDLIIHVRLDQIDNGEYLIKHHQINQKYGSVQDEWVGLNMETELNMEELDYLKRICVPRLATQKLIVDRNVLEFDIYLLANEMQYLNILRR